MNRPPRSVAVLGNAADIKTWSNIPYFFSEAGKRAGFITHALDLSMPDYDRRKKLWAAGMLATLRKPTMYQSSRAHHRAMWEKIPEELRAGEIVSHKQAFPPPDLAAKSGTRFAHYVDMTLSQLFTNPADRPSLIRDMIARERDGYHAARCVIGMARAAAASMTNDYGVDPAKVFVVRAGANLHEPVVQAFEQTTPVPAWRQGEPFTPDTPAVLGMIAADPLRKGLPKLVNIAEALARRGRPVRVCVVGNCPDDLRRHPLVDAAGFIQKSDEQAFVAKCATFAFGCLLSSAEALGIGTLESLRLGVPVLGHRVGGIPDCVPDDAGLLIEPGTAPADVADALDPLLFDPARYAALCAAARAQRDSVTWDHAVARMQAIWSTLPA